VFPVPGGVKHLEVHKLGADTNQGNHEHHGQPAGPPVKGALRR
jgi:hypothetical protein